MAADFDTKVISTVGIAVQPTFLDEPTPEGFFSLTLALNSLKESIDLKSRIIDYAVLKASEIAPSAPKLPTLEIRGYDTFVFLSEGYRPRLYDSECQLIPRDAISVKAGSLVRCAGRLALVDRVVRLELDAVQIVRPKASRCPFEPVGWGYRHHPHAQRTKRWRRGFGKAER